MKKTKRVSSEMALYRHVARYMRPRGWAMVASGPISIESRGRKFCYRWVLDFVGKPIPSRARGEG